ncbi:UVR8, partial [Symbiodinium necroappetens]
MQSIRSSLLAENQASAGDSHTCAVKSDGQLVCFGWNQFGQCDVPEDIGETLLVSAGHSHTCAITADGRLVCFGWNEYGQCDVPRNLGPVLTVSAGRSHTCAITAEGQLVCFGYNSDGQCAVPADLGPVVAVSAGESYTCTVKADGQLVCFGSNEYGACDVPADLGPVVAVSAGPTHSCAVCADRQLVCFGSNEYGACEVPSDLGPVLAASAGRFRTCAVKADGKLISFGNNNQGKCDVPADLGRAVLTSAGGYHTCAVMADGQLTCFGANPDGRCDVPEDLGYESEFPTTPVMIQVAKDLKEILEIARGFCASSAAYAGKDCMGYADRNQIFVFWRAAATPTISSIEAGSPLLSGVSFFEFHVRYDKGGSEMDFGIFQLGDYPVAEFDYFGDEFQAWCLVPAAKGDGELPRAVASAYGGSADFSQLCIPDPRKVTLTSHGYRSIAEQEKPERMQVFIDRLVAHFGGKVTNSHDRDEFARGFTFQEGRREGSLRFASLVVALQEQPGWASWNNDVSCVADRDSHAPAVGSAVGDACRNMKEFRCLEIPEACKSNIWDVADYDVPVASVPPAAQARVSGDGEIVDKPTTLHQDRGEFRLRDLAMYACSGLGGYSASSAMTGNAGTYSLPPARSEGLRSEGFNYCPGQTLK